MDYLGTGGEARGGEVGLLPGAGPQWLWAVGGTVNAGASQAELGLKQAVPNFSVFLYKWMMANASTVGQVKSNTAQLPALVLLQGHRQKQTSRPAI